MDELRDSMPVATDAAVLRERIAGEGYVFFRGLLDADEVRMVGHQVAASLHARGLLARRSSCTYPRPRSRPLGIQDQSYWDLYRAAQAIEAVHRLPHDPRLQGLMHLILGEDVFVHPSCIMRMVWPAAYGGPRNPNVHRDFPNWRIPDMFTTWIPFLDCPRKRGGLHLLRGSQNQGLACPSVLNERDPAWATADYEPGDVVVFHALTVHGAPPNRTGQIRLSTDYRWQALSVPAPHWVLNPDGAVPGWDVLTAGWSSAKWVQAPAGLRLTEDADEVWEELTELPPSRFVNVPDATTR
jgi:hypothetical protein